MNNYVLSCCSTVDLSAEHLEKRGIEHICFHFFINETPYLDDLGKTIPFDEFYRKMANGAETKTSQINADEYIAYFEKFLEQGRDILHVTLSSGISGSINSANIARGALKKKYPERKIYIVDSLGASSGYGLLMDKAADMRDSGMTIDELKEWIESNRLKLHHWFFSTDLTYYVKGGRISKASGWFGTMLKICPLLDVDDQGKLIPRHKIRGKKAVIESIVEKMKKHAENGASYSGKCYISNSACMEDAQEVAKRIESYFKKLDGKVVINSIGTTIGSHTGPGTVALFFWGSERI